MPPQGGAGFRCGAGFRGPRAHALHPSPPGEASACMWASFLLMLNSKKRRGLPYTFMYSYLHFYKQGGIKGFSLLLFAHMNRPLIFL